jgi:magnesium chelatase family protein
MVAKIKTVAFNGIETLPIEAEVHIAGGLPAFTIVGLPDKAVGESKERVRAALHAMGLSLPPKRITVNLAPADVTKEGSHYDLPIALGLLVAMEVVPSDALIDFVALGEMGLDGGLRPISGVLPAAMHSVSNDNGLICPFDCRDEATWSGSGSILAPKNLLQLINHLKGTQVMEQDLKPRTFQNNAAFSHTKDMRDIKGQETAKRALEIAAAGRHNMVMCGQPGSGKSMLAERLPTIIPDLNARDALEISMIHSIAGTLPDSGLVMHRPFRNPHHSASLPALVGGGTKAKPGEISLAHKGVLFLDELPEFNRATLESLRQPLETKEAVIARVQSRATYPADFQLIAAMNPCRCGYMGDPDRECTRAPKCGLDYQSKISGPFMDRMDIFIDVPPVTIADLRSEGGGEDSAVIKERVTRAQNIQFARNGVGKLNNTLTTEDIDRFCQMDAETSAFFDAAIDKLKLSARGYYRVLKVARTIADLDGGAEMLSKSHVAEALSYRAKTYLNT